MGAMCCVLRDAKNIGELHALPLAPSASGITSFHRGLRGGSSDRRDTEGRPLSDSQGSRADSNSGLFPSYSGPGSSLWGRILAPLVGLPIVLGVSVKTRSSGGAGPGARRVPAGGRAQAGLPTRRPQAARVGAHGATRLSYSSASCAL